MQGAGLISVNRFFFFFGFGFGFLLWERGIFG